MKIGTNKYPIAFKFCLAIILFASVLIISGLTNRGLIKQYIPYVSCILLFVVTWFLYKTEKKSLKSIGLNFSLRNIALLPLGTLIGIVALFIARFLRSMYLNESFELSQSIDFTFLSLAFYFILPQVATEEFLFRGYLFKKTIETSNVVIANIIFSIVFMLIHVLDDSVMSNTGKLVMLVVSIPVGHLLFATALLRSKSLFFPIGIHLGNNWATRHLIGEADSVHNILYISNPYTFETWTPFIMVLIIFNGFILLITFIIWKWEWITKLTGRFPFQN